MENGFPLRDRLKARLALVRQDLEEVIERLSDADLDWAPTQGMRTIGGQLVEIIGTEIMLLKWMRDAEKMSFKEAEAVAREAKSLAELHEILDSTRADTLEFIDSLSDEQLDAYAPFPSGWFESLGRGAVPRSEALRSIAQHEWYHVGQLVSYLWSRGDNPYEW